jgi:hypothetical protein
LVRFLYKSWYERNLLDLNFTRFVAKRCVLDVILQVFVRKNFLNLNFTGVCPEKNFEPFFGYVRENLFTSSFLRSPTFLGKIGAFFGKK